jgi:hypothetical protein
MRRAELTAGGRFPSDAGPDEFAGDEPDEGDSCEQPVRRRSETITRTAEATGDATAGRARARALPFSNVFSTTIAILA